MVAIKVRQQTQALLNDPMLGEGNEDAKILRLLEGEYLRQLTQCRDADHALSQKYQMTFDEFVERRTTVQHENSWEVEKDAMDWEGAIGGIVTLERKLAEVKELTHVPGQ